MCEMREKRGGEYLLTRELSRNSYPQKFCPSDYLPTIKQSLLLQYVAESRTSIKYYFLHQWPCRRYFVLCKISRVDSNPDSPVWYSSSPSAESVRLSEAQTLMQTAARNHLPRHKAQPISRSLTGREQPVPKQWWHRISSPFDPTVLDDICLFSQGSWACSKTGIHTQTSTIGAEGMDFDRRVLAVFAQSLRE